MILAAESSIPHCFWKSYTIKVLRWTLLHNLIQEHIAIQFIFPPHKSRMALQMLTQTAKTFGPIQLGNLVYQTEGTITLAGVFMDFCLRKLFI